ncbi:MAG: glycosyltransferase [Oscillibacter sp.]|nr:glycosyltransferase [Oscillibacter sp.]
MKHIAIFQSDLRVGGIQKALINILREIDYASCQVDLYLYDEGSFFDMPSDDNLKIIRLNPGAAALKRFVYFDLLYALSGDITHGKEYDAAIDFNSYQNECAVGALKCRARKKIMWIHNDMEIKLRNEPKYRVLWHFFKGKLRRYDAFAAVSPGIIDGFRRASGVRDKPIVPIPNHIDTEEIFRKKDLPVEFQPDPDKLNLCSVGRICRQKGYDLLMGYLAEVKKRRRDFHFYLIGDGPDRAALERQIASLGLGGFVTLLGNQKNPFCYMDKLDGFVLTSRYEGQGMVIREAQALGLPIYISKNLEPYNPGIAGCADMTEALCGAEKPSEKRYDDLSDYNAAITRDLKRLLGLA